MKVNELIKRLEEFEKIEPNGEVNVVVDDRINGNYRIIKVTETSEILEQFFIDIIIK